MFEDVSDTLPVSQHVHRPETNVTLLQQHELDLCLCKLCTELVGNVLHESSDLKLSDNSHTT